MSYNISGTAALILLIAIVTLPALILLSLYAITSKRYRKHLFKAGQTVIAEYSAPDNLTPAEVGYLFKFRSSIQELYGTAFDLERRGYITVDRLPDGLKITVKNPDPTGLKAHEVLLISQPNALAVPNGAQKQQFVLAFQISVSRELREAGYLKGSVVLHYLKAVIWSVLLMDLVFPGIFLVISPSLTTLGVFFFFSFVLGIFFYGPVALVLAGLYTAMTGHAWMGTTKMKTVWPEILGFRSYIQLAELGQIKYNSEDLRLSCTNYAFPYAVALGFNTNWQKPQ
jgi:hypothetical protein